MFRAIVSGLACLVSSSGGEGLPVCLLKTAEALGLLAPVAGTWRPAAWRCLLEAQGLPGSTQRRGHSVLVVLSLTLMYASEKRG